MKTAVVIQARFDSSRLPGKALMNLAGAPLLVWTMRALKQVSADYYVLATDDDGYKRFAGYAALCGYVCIAGPKENVLERFCQVIKETGADIILRATGDNPYLFYEAAAWSLAHFAEQNADYFTLTGLPHGSGVEVFSAASLLDAASHTADPYDCEHVGPALYRHTDRYHAVFMESPAEWHYPQLRTTVDTPKDFQTAYGRASFLLNAAAISDDGDIISFMQLKPPSCNDIVSATHPVVFAPCVVQGRGTGHLRRCLQLLAIVPNSFLYLSPQVYSEKDKKNSVPEICRILLSEIPPAKIVRPGDNSCALVVLDGFRTDARHMTKFRRFGPVLALDEGGNGRKDADYLLDILPGLPSCPPNMLCPDFIPLPSTRRDVNELCEKKEPETILVSIGGEDPASLSQPVAAVLSSVYPAAKITVTGYSAPAAGNISYSAEIAGLKDILATYDLVVTHYGFTAFEAAAAGCAVLLVGTSRYHVKLSKAAGFECIPSNCLHDDRYYRYAVSELFRRPFRLPVSFSGKQKDLASFITHCADTVNGGCHCPVCHSHEGTVIARTESGTFRQCKTCSLIYRENFSAEISSYGTSYFFEEYTKQYGKTYLEDFSQIKQQGLRRAAEIKRVLKNVRDVPTVLDIGCAYGPFLDAAREQGFEPYGIDIPEDAVNYVQHTLGISATVGHFPDCAERAASLVPGGKYDALTMWWVIEHFADLQPVLTATASLLKGGGVFAFSTPSAAGVSAVYNHTGFYSASPVDHYTVWSPRTVTAILRRFGFTVVSCISTGHHPERFPQAHFQHNEAESGANRIEYDKLLRKSRKKNLGDSFEVYAVKGI